MPDLAEQLARLYSSGFEIQTFERFPRAVGVIRDQCIALLQATPQGMQMMGTPGWRLGEAIGVLVEHEGRRVFRAKSEMVEATPERLETLRRFRDDLAAVLSPLN